MTSTGKYRKIFLSAICTALLIGAFVFPVLAAGLPDPDMRGALVLDLDRDGVETIGMKAGIQFDLNDDGFRETLCWVAADDGLLALDRDGDGAIASGAELFGNSTRLADGATAANGFLALAEFDENNNGYIDDADKGFSRLRVWRDANQNGESEPEELLTLADTGVETILLRHRESNTKDAFGNEFRQFGAFNTTDGKGSVVLGVWFDNNPTLSRPLKPVTVPAALANLPNIAGFGRVRSLHEAMALDGSGRLERLVRKFVDEPDKPARDALVREILFEMAGGESSPIPYKVESAKEIISPEQLATLTAFWGGARFEAVNGPAHARQLAGRYRQLEDGKFRELMSQSHLKDVFGVIYLNRRPNFLFGTMLVLQKAFADPARAGDLFKDYWRSVRGIDPYTSRYRVRVLTPLIWPVVILIGWLAWRIISRNRALRQAKTPAPGPVMSSREEHEESRPEPFIPVRVERTPGTRASMVSAIILVAVIVVGFAFAIVSQAQPGGYSKRDARALQKCADYFNSGNFEKAFSCYSSRSDQGDPFAETSLAMMYTQGIHVDKDYEEAERRYTHVLDTTEIPQVRRFAMRGMGLLYLLEDFPKHDLKISADWIRQSADLGDKDSQGTYGVILLLGHGVPRDVEQAKEYLRKAADAGNEGAKGVFEAESKFNDEEFLDGLYKNFIFGLKVEQRPAAKAPICDRTDPVCIAKLLYEKGASFEGEDENLKQFFCKAENWEISARFSKESVKKTFQSRGIDFHKQKKFDFSGLNYEAREIPPDKVLVKVEGPVSMEIAETDYKFKKDIVDEMILVRDKSGKYCYSGNLKQGEK